MWKALYLLLGGLGGREGISFLKEGAGIQLCCLMCCLVAGCFSVPSFGWGMWAALSRRRQDERRQKGSGCEKAILSIKETNLQLVLSVVKLLERSKRLLIREHPLYEGKCSQVCCHGKSRNCSSEVFRWHWMCLFHRTVGRASEYLILTTTGSIKYTLLEVLNTH